VGRQDSLTDGKDSLQRAEQLRLEAMQRLFESALAYCDLAKTYASMGDRPQAEELVVRATRCMNAVQSKLEEEQPIPPTAPQHESLSDMADRLSEVRLKIDETLRMISVPADSILPC